MPNSSKAGSRRSPDDHRHHQVHQYVADVGTGYLRARAATAHPQSFRHGANTAGEEPGAIANNLAYTEFLMLLVDDEFARRRDRLFTRRLKSARVPQLKTLDSFDWSFNPQIPKALILDLATVRFVSEH